MTELYVNNFRGFRDTFIPIDKVNFLIGENSTGKTSILKLIRVLSNYEFWRNLDLNSGDLNSRDFHFGYFSELCDRDFFEIGFRNKNFSYRNKAQQFITILRFVNENGISTVSHIRILTKNAELELKFSEFNAMYRVVFAEKDINNTKFEQWVNSRITDDVKFNFFRREEIPQKLKKHISFFRLFVSMIKNNGDTETAKLLDSFEFFTSLVWFSPIRAQPKRTYDNYKISFSPDGSHIPFLLKNLLPTPQSNGKERKTFQTALNKFGQDSGLFDKIEVLGEEQTTPLEIRVFFGENNIKISNVGYGVSQILPLIIEVLTNEKNEWYAIQQPEIHLHPRGQAAFGELIYDTQKADNKTFIIETHSDYIVDRFRLCVNKNKEETSDEFQVLFFERTKDGNKVTPIKIQSNGKYTNDQPKSFQEFFIKEQLELIKI